MKANQGLWNIYILFFLSQSDSVQLPGSTWEGCRAVCRNVHLRRVEPAGVRQLHGETSQPALLQQIPGPLFGQESGEVPEYRLLYSFHYGNYSVSLHMYKNHIKAITNKQK